MGKMQSEKFWQSISLVLIAGWLFMTLVVDFVAVPTIFRTVTNIQQAGAVGLKVFSVLNTAELIIGLALIGLFFLGKSASRFLIGGLVILTCLASFYNFYLSPKIEDITHELRSKSYEEHGEKYYNTLESEHATYHDMYVKLDGGKILLLLLVLGESIRVSSRREES